MKASRVIAVGLVAAAAFWVASGHLFPPEAEKSRAAIRPEAAEAKLFRVAVAAAEVVPHGRKLILSGRTEADRRVTVFARSGGIVTELKVRRGSRVEKDDIVAVLSDEARDSQVVQAQALVVQRKTELNAKRRLIEIGAWPKLELVNLEAQIRAAEATLALAEAERDRGVVRAPWTGIVTDTMVEVGQAAFSFAGREIAQIIAFDPMLAIVEVAERHLAGVRVGEDAEIRLVTGHAATGRIRFVSNSASQTTRTYRIEVEVPNPAGAIPDGITTEVAIPMTPIMAVRVPRSALTVSSGGDIGVRMVADDDKVGFIAVNVVEDEQAQMWVSGIPAGARVIVQGQDFVREGQRVAVVPVMQPQAGGP